MAQGSGFRINTNVAALNSYNALMDINKQMGQYQLALASGKRINSVADDPAGFTIARKLQARSRGISQALNNVGDAKSVLSTAEGGLQTVSDILVSIKEKVTQATNGSMGDTELAAIVTQVQDFSKEIDSIIGQTKFNGQQLLDNNYTGKTFQIGADATDTLTFSLTATISSADLGLDTLSTANIGSATTLASVDAAIDKLSTQLQTVGSLLDRLNFSESNLNVQATNMDAAASQIYDADMAKEQLNLTKLNILQQTAVAQLTQANAAPNVVMQLFR
jgi:flagellin